MDIAASMLRKETRHYKNYMESGVIKEEYSIHPANDLP